MAVPARAAKEAGLPMMPRPTIISGGKQDRPVQPAGTRQATNESATEYLERKVAEQQATIAALTQVLDLYIAGSDALAAISAKLREKPEAR